MYPSVINQFVAGDWSIDSKVPVDEMPGDASPELLSLAYAAAHAT